MRIATGQAIENGSGTEVLGITSGTVDFKSGSDTNDGMTANPETDTESGFVTVQLNGSEKQIPVYDP
jgi:hypothetical protein